ncbi:NB-ARC domain containing protein, partial [Trema orientale]
VPLFIRIIARDLNYRSREYWRYFDVKKKLVELMKNFSLNSAVNPQETRDANGERRQTHSFIPQEVIIGRDIDKEAITVQLLKDNFEENVLVLPIVGIGGLGKTALAQLIFNDGKVQRHFDLKIWVCVTDVFDVKVIVEKIIVSITSRNPKNPALDQLENLLRQEIQGKQYLLILDDVWNEDAEEWLRLKALLSVGANGSRIIVTTRSRTVAEITGDKLLYDLSPLDEDMSWSLFMKVAFEQGKQPSDSETIKIGKEIVKKCGGIPLVIRAIGSILFSKNPETEWKSFYDKELSKILESEADVLASLRLSYDHLSPPLKECFAYCVLFPKEYEIDVETLISLWMSQGFIEPNSESEKHLDDLGYGCFMDLLRRSFFQETQKDEWGNITKCKLQNLMHDLARLVAGNACATLGLKGGKFDRLPRHISFDFHLDSSWQIPSSLAELKRIRSFILPRQFRSAIEGRSNESVCDGFIKFKFLRMLDLHNSGIKVLPNSIGELTHLRYLDLSQNVNIKALPNSICGLQNLQTLKLNHCSDLQRLPREIKKLVNLRNLENESCYSLTHMPRGLSQVINLRTLTEFVLSKGTYSVANLSGKLDELKELNDLRGKLKIKNLRFREVDKTEDASLYKKQDLLSLIYIWDIDTAVDPADCERSLEDLRPHPNLKELSLSAYGGIKFSSWLPSHKNLVKFSLSSCFRCQCLPPLDDLPSLEVLVVDELAELEYISDKMFRNESRTCFPSLKELRLTNLPKLKRWWKDETDNVEETTFPCLSKLIIEDCPNLTFTPLFPCLEELLVLKNTSWEPFRRTIAAEIGVTGKFESEASSSTSSRVAPLSKLRTLFIIDMSNSELSMWQSFLSLRSLTLDHLADINALLGGLQQLTSLQELHIWRCDSLKEIPSWISNIKSLKTISIKLCPSLTIPRDRINLITCLKKVEIEDCPEVSHIESMLKDRRYK